jgi:hypothetical protein
MGTPGRAYMHDSQTMEDIETWYFPRSIPVLRAMCESCEANPVSPSVVPVSPSVVPVPVSLVPSPSSVTPPNLTSLPPHFPPYSPVPTATPFSLLAATSFHLRFSSPTLSATSPPAPPLSAILSVSSSQSIIAIIASKITSKNQNLQLTKKLSLTTHSVIFTTAILPLLLVLLLIIALINRNIFYNFASKNPGFTLSMRKDERIAHWKLLKLLSLVPIQVKTSKRINNLSWALDSL